MSLSSCFLLRCLHADCSLLVRRQSHPRLLRPAVRRSQVSHTQHLLHSVMCVCDFLLLTLCVMVLQVRAGYWSVSGLGSLLSGRTRRVHALLLLQEDFPHPPCKVNPQHHTGMHPTCSTGVCPQGALQVWRTVSCIILSFFIPLPQRMLDSDCLKFGQHPHQCLSIDQT